uniref:tripeptidyl-peptidase II n=1 Tax=Moniliophthora roreri TaxID=221103 RepID=A0A0W0G632_MONRR
MRLLLGLCGIFGIVAYAAPSLNHNHLVHERRTIEPLHWLQTRRADPDQAHVLRIGLKQQHLDKLDDVLLSIADPRSTSYGQHWSLQKVRETFAPSRESTRAVLDWLLSSGIPTERTRLSSNKAWIIANTSISEAEKLLHTEYHSYAHVETGVEEAGCKQYSIPDHLTAHIDLIRPTVDFNRNPSSQRKGQRLGAFGGPKQDASSIFVTPSLSTCDQYITLDCLRALYNFDYKPIATDKNTYGIVEFTPQAYVPEDLDIFFGNFSPSQVGARPELVSIDGGVVQTQTRSFEVNGESNLDLEYAMALTNPQPVLLLQTGDLVEGAGFDNWLDAVDGEFCTFEGGDDPEQDGIYPDPLPGGYNGPESCGIIPPPYVVSISYGQDENTISSRSAIRQCNEYAKLGLMGSTVLYSSGDNGVAGNGGVCLTEDGYPSKKGSVFNPGFPVTCPYVTAVGATQIDRGKTVHDPESACEQVIFSGGGFSNIFSIPAYQENHVAEYMKNTNLSFSGSHYNSTGKSRAFPDLSANGANYIISVSGTFHRVFGTSASAPVVGAMISMINDARIAKGKGPVGFINPAIYSKHFAEAFNDIVKGSNPGCGTPGFPSTPGWDPVTGESLGTPDFSKLMTLFMDLP